MIAGYRPIATKRADDRAHARAKSEKREDAAENAQRPCMVDAATTEPRLTIGPTERSIPPVSMTIVSAAATIAVGNQPWTNLAIAPTVKMPGNKNA